jgi:hypothetical protein
MELCAAADVLSESIDCFYPLFAKTDPAQCSELPAHGLSPRSLTQRTAGQHRFSALGEVA